MNNPLLILYLEDSPRDVELVRDNLQQAHMACELRVARDRAEYEAALAQTRFDLILSDYSLPDYDGLAALAWAREKQPEVPFILVSGTLGEEKAVDCMLRGTTDYVLKHRLERLAPAVTRALQEAEEHRARLNAEAEVRASEQQFRAMFEVAAIGVAQADPQTGRWLRVNRKMCAITGYSAAEMLQMRVLDITHPEDRQVDGEEFQRVVRGEAPAYRLEKRYLRKDGSVVWVNVNMTVIRDATGQPTRTLATIEDVTERKVAEVALRDAESLYHSLVEHLPQSVFRKDREGRFTYVNSRFCALMGKTKDELLGKTASDFFPPELAERFRQEERRVMQMQTVFDAVEDHLLVGNPKAVLHVLKAPVRSASGESLGVQGILMDITSQTALEAKFLRAQRLESIGSLASGIAHDLNNILSPIMMCAPLLREELPSKDREHMLSLIEASTQRAVGIVKQLLSFGRGESDQKTPLQARHLIREIAKIVHETFPRSIQVKEECASDLWLVLGNATQLHQVLLNLCVNARDAMPSGGTLTLRAENVMLDENYVSMLEGVSAGPFVRIQVQDTGTGIPESAREHIFDSFFTTKSHEQGTGLGLTTVLGIVKNHHGWTTFTTAEGKGTTFEIHLPATPETLPCAQSNQASGATPRGHGELILLVDDEPPVHAASRRTLERHGYAVLLAPDGIEALAQFTSRQADIKAVVTDFMMPHMDGVTLARTLRRLSPQTPIIVSSGGLLSRDAADSLQAFKALGIRDILHKPHGAEVLLRALDDALHSATPALPQGATGA